MPSKSDDATIETPPTLMSRSDSLGTPPATNAWASTTERIGRAAEVGPDPAHGLGQRRLVAAGRQAATARAAPAGRGRGGRGPRPGRGASSSSDRRADRRGVGAHEDPGGVDQPGAEAEPLGRVVVAGRQHDPGPRGGEPGERLVGQPYGVDVGQGAVVDVAGDHHEVDPLRLDHLDQVVDEGRLVVEHADAVERATQVPVGGVEDPHTTNLGTSTDTDPAPHAESAQEARKHAESSVRLGIRRSGRCAPRG